MYQPSTQAIMDIESQKQPQQQPLSTLNHAPIRPRMPILKLKTDLPAYPDEEMSPSPKSSPDTWDWPIALRQLTGFFLFALQLLSTTSWQPSLLSLVIPISSSFLLITDAVITCLVIVISSYVHFCLASLDYEPVWVSLPVYTQKEGVEEDRWWSWKPKHFYIMALVETVILVGAVSTGLRDVCLWGLCVVTAGSWFLGWRLGAVKVMTVRLCQSVSWRIN